MGRRRGDRWQFQFWAIKEKLFLKIAFSIRRGRASRQQSIISRLAWKWLRSILFNDCPVCNVAGQASWKAACWQRLCLGCAQW